MTIDSKGTGLETHYVIRAVTAQSYLLTLTSITGPSLRRTFEATFEATLIFEHNECVTSSSSGCGVPQEGHTVDSVVKALFNLWLKDKGFMMDDIVEVMSS